MSTLQSVRNEIAILNDTWRQARKSDDGPDWWHGEKNPFSTKELKDLGAKLWTVAEEMFRYNRQSKFSRDDVKETLIEPVADVVEDIAERIGIERRDMYWPNFETFEVTRGKPENLAAQEEYAAASKGLDEPYQEFLMYAQDLMPFKDPEQY